MNTTCSGCLALLLAVALPVQAAFNDLGNGLVNDTAQDITWLQDANMVKTLCDASDSLWQNWPEPNPAVTNNTGRTKVQICNAGGTLNWHEAEAWVAHMRANSYLGYADWRLPSTGQPDPTCSDYSNDGVDNDMGHRCTGSEMGHLFNAPATDGLENPNNLDDACNPNCFENSGPFLNVTNYWYWSGTESATHPTSAWFFRFSDALQSFVGKIHLPINVWPVRPELTSVSPPDEHQPVPVLNIWGLILLTGVLGLVATFTVRRRYQ